MHNKTLYTNKTHYSKNTYCT